MAGIPVASSVRIALVFILDYVSSYKKYFVKTIIVSALIIGYILVLHYPRIVMYGLIVAPWEHTQADYAVIMRLGGEGIGDAAGMVDRLVSACQVDPGSYGYTMELVYRGEGYQGYNEGEGLTVILMDKPETSRYMIAYPVAGRFPYSGSEVAVPAVTSSMNVGVGDAIEVGGYRFKVVGEVFVSPVHSPIFQGINADAIIGVYDGLMREFVHKSFARDDVYKVVVLMRASRDQVKGCVDLWKSTDRVEVLHVVDVEESLRRDREVYYNDYGSGTSWSIVSYAASIILVLYMVKVALTDVNEKMRETLALLYSMGASDLVVGLILALKFTAIAMASIVLGLALSGLYMRLGLETPLSIYLLAGNLSWLVVAAVATGMTASIVAGVLGARRSSLAEVLNGA